ncbi:MAG: ribose-phosphate pyrophosphokinase-like domain-containing protein [Candidatus Aenigmarchaeota archaeon]|nr:ribose-phosphate pyrophosphokinase-like domain-containing protein [Candidatus Aenigmarchaeota archaeon]
MIIIGRKLNEDDVFCEELTEKLTRLNSEDADFFPVEHRHHPDSETLPRLTDGFRPADGIENIKTISEAERQKLGPDEKSLYEPPKSLIRRIRSGEKAIVVSRSVSGEHWDPTDIFMDTLFLTGEIRDRCRKADMCVVWPYYPYSRQHDRYRTGEPHSAKYVRKVITDNTRFADMLITVSAHNYRTTGEMDGNCWNMDATPSVTRYLECVDFLPDRYLVTCDSGQSQGELRFPIAEAINAGTIALRKERDRLSGEVSARTKVMEDIPEGQRGNVSLIYYDDEIATGGTLVEHIKRVLDLGFNPENIHVVAVAAKNNYNTKLGNYGCSCIEDLGVRIAASDSIESTYAKFSIIPELAGYVHDTFW